MANSSGTIWEEGLRETIEIIGNAENLSLTGPPIVSMASRVFSRALAALFLFPLRACSARGSAAMNF
jgi:hypothetical protein